MSLLSLLGISARTPVQISVINPTRLLTNILMPGTADYFTKLAKAKNITFEDAIRIATYNPKKPRTKKPKLKPVLNPDALKPEEPLGASVPTSTDEAISPSSPMNPDGPISPSAPVNPYGPESPSARINPYGSDGFKATPIDDSNSSENKVEPEPEKKPVKKPLTKQELSDKLFELLTDFAHKIIQLLGIYVPIDTGRLLSSFYYKTGRKEIILGFNLKKCPYATIVHEKVDVRHPNGGISKFLYQAVLDAMKALPYARYINTEFVVNREELKVILNGKNSNTNQLLQKDTGNILWDEQNDIEATYNNQYNIFNDPKVRIDNDEQMLAMTRRYEKKRSVLTGKENVFMKNMFKPNAYNKVLPWRLKNKVDIAVDGTAFNHNVSDPRRDIFKMIGSDIEFEKPTTFKGATDFYNI